ncbi:hypothetical protein INS49_005202 [Diaporthe citri]|uniref:uncharacterized protein n=1 Tax=Diaporthe citri TaxID=83186 RepID=UPI001C7F01FD|nr:uncharacterized protein INS49_005202 [Diaporthe citri]KAG6353945.1 hypothetical protein INS49_005202 [Diaporthe citri]
MATCAWSGLAGRREPVVESWREHSQQPHQEAHSLIVIFIVINTTHHCIAIVMASFGTMNQGPGRPRKQGGPWTTAENERLTFLVNRHESIKSQLHWVEIARNHGTRDAKQCRERWDNHLKPGLNREKISAEEGVYILDWVKENGKRWAPLGREIKRPENMVKNYYYQEHKKSERGITKHRRHGSRHRPLHDRLSSSVPMSRDNSSSSSHQAYGRSSASPVYASAPNDYNHRVAGQYYQHYTPYDYSSRRTSVASVMTNPPSLTPDHGSPAESPRAGAEIPYPPGQFALPSYHPQPVEIPLSSGHYLVVEGAGHKRSNSASSYGSFSMAHPHSPTSFPIRIGFLDRQRQPAVQAPSIATPAFSDRRPTQPSPPRNSEQAASNSRKNLDVRMSLSHILG